LCTWINFSVTWRLGNWLKLAWEEWNHFRWAHFDTISIRWKYVLIIRALACGEAMWVLRASPRNHELLHNAISWPWKGMKKRKKEKRKRKMTLKYPLVWIIVLLHLWVGPSLYVILKWILQEGSYNLVPPSECEHLERAWTSLLASIFPQRQALKFYMVGSKHVVHLDYPHMILPYWEFFYKKIVFITCVVKLLKIPLHT